MKDKKMNNTTHATCRKQDKNMVGAETKVRTPEIKCQPEIFPSDQTDMRKEWWDVVMRDMVQRLVFFTEKGKEMIRHG